MIFHNVKQQNVEEPRLSISIALISYICIIELLCIGTNSQLLFIIILLIIINFFHYKYYRLSYYNNIFILRFTLNLIFFITNLI